MASNILSMKAIHEAIQSDNKDQLQILIQRGISFNLTWPAKGYTPLHRVADQGNIEFAHILLGAGAEINATDSIGNTPFHFASKTGKIEMARLLLDAGANINATNSRGDTPFHIVAESGGIEFARLLVDAGADINAKNGYGNTPFHKVAEYGNSIIAPLLVDNGADTNAANERGETPIHLAAGTGNFEVVRLLIESGANIHTTDNYGRTPFFQAVAWKASIEVLHLLIGAGADINAADQNGETPFHFVPKKCKIELARLLIDAGANINSTDNDGNTPLHREGGCWNIGTGNIEIARLMLEAGADINAINKLGERPLHLSGYQIRDIVLEKLYAPLYLTHVVKLKCLGLHVSEENMSYLREKFDEELRTFEKQCETEIASMKKQKIHEGYRFSLCDMLTKGEDVLRMVFQVREVRVKLEELIRNMSYPAYGNMISMKYERIVRIVEYSVNARKIIGFIVNSVQSIPEECIDKIASYFTDKDMKDLARRFK